MLQVNTVVYDASGLEKDAKHFLSPNVSDAICGLNEFITIMFWHEINNKFILPETFKIKMYLVNIEDNKIVGDREKLFDGQFEFYPERLKKTPLGVNDQFTEMPNEDEYISKARVN